MRCGKIMGKALLFVSAQQEESLHKTAIDTETKKQGGFAIDHPVLYSENYFEKVLIFPEIQFVVTNICFDFFGFQQLVKTIFYVFLDEPVIYI